MTNILLRKQELEKEIAKGNKLIEEGDITNEQLDSYYTIEAELKGIVDTERHYKEEIEKVLLEFVDVRLTYRDVEDLKKRLFGDEK